MPYHYRESGLPNVYLNSGYREVQTPYGPSVVISDVEGLHLVIAQMIVKDRPHMTGPELRFIRRFLEWTQSELADLLGVEEQSVRRWEKLARVPKPADRAMRLLFLNAIEEPPAFDQVIAHANAKTDAPTSVNLQFRPRVKEWAQTEAAA